MASEPRRILLSARQAGRAMALLSTQQKNDVLEAFAARVGAHSSALLKANAKDLAAGNGKISRVLMNRLELSPTRIEMIVKMILGVRDLDDPTGKIVRQMELDSGLEMIQKTVPLGVLVVVFESRPDVIPQISSLVLKSGNAVVLKGGREAAFTNSAFEKLWLDVGKQFNFLPKQWLQQVSGRAEFRSLLKHHDLIDLVIPRGSNALVRSVMKHTKAPVLGHAQGICSMFIHESAIVDTALELVVDAKLQAPSTCNAIETLLVQKSIAKEFFARFEDVNEEMKIQVRACSRTRKFLKRAVAATDKDFHREFGDERLAIKIVNTLKDAIDHINLHGSHHTDTIVAQDADACAQFFDNVDSATVLSNASTRFNDGYRLGLGAEVGVSTSKLHVRGPAGLDSLVTTKFIVRGEGQVVSDYTGTAPKPFKHKVL